MQLQRLRSNLDEIIRIRKNECGRVERKESRVRRTRVTDGEIAGNEPKTLHAARQMLLLTPSSIWWKIISKRTGHYSSKWLTQASGELPNAYNNSNSKEDYYDVSNHEKSNHDEDSDDKDAGSFNATRNKNVPSFFNVLIILLHPDYHLVDAYPTLYAITVAIPIPRIRSTMW